MRYSSRYYKFANVSDEPGGSLLRQMNELFWRQR